MSSISAQPVDATKNAWAQVQAKFHPLFQILEVVRLLSFGIFIVALDGVLMDDIEQGREILRESASNWHTLFNWHAFQGLEAVFILSVFSWYWADFTIYLRRSDW